jgi:hypothetical protein
MAGHNENKMLKIEGLKFKATQGGSFLIRDVPYAGLFVPYLTHYSNDNQIFLSQFHMERCFSNGMHIYAVFHCETCEDQHSFEGRYSGCSTIYLKFED